MKKVVINGKEYESLEREDRPTSEQIAKLRCWETKMIISHNRDVGTGIGDAAKEDPTKPTNPGEGVSSDYILAECKKVQEGKRSTFGEAYMAFRTLWGEHIPVGCIGLENTFYSPYRLQLFYTHDGRLIAE